mmetsp:Transcript_96677/g.282590  ORF Transcript_96677/g.282590 Transcript_96677/m.282590 type:complete len:128 (+) Transcript_96677:101-484(+)
MGIFAGFLLLWGSVLDLVVLFAMPLLGQCDGFNGLTKFTSCTAPLSTEGRLCVYFFGACGVCRLLAGLYPAERGAWLACAASMALEIAFNAQQVGMGQDALGVYGLCGPTLLYMVLNIPSATKIKDP